MSSLDNNEYVKHFYEDDNYYINITLIYVITIYFELILG